MHASTEVAFTEVYLAVSNGNVTQLKNRGKKKMQTVTQKPNVLP